MLFLASSSIVDDTSMCICPCGFSSTTSKRTSVFYHLTSGAISTSSFSDQGSPLFYNVTTNASDETSASASLNSFGCYCPCSPTTSSPPYMFCKLSMEKNQFIAIIWWYFYTNSRNSKYLRSRSHLFQHPRIPPQMLAKVHRHPQQSPSFLS